MGFVSKREDDSDRIHEQRNLDPTQLMCSVSLAKEQNELRESFARLAAYTRFGARLNEAIQRKLAPLRGHENLVMHPEGNASKESQEQIRALDTELAKFKTLWETVRRELQRVQVGVLGCPQARLDEERLRWEQARSALNRRIHSQESDLQRLRALVDKLESEVVELRPFASDAAIESLLKGQAGRAFRSIGAS